MTYSPPTSNSQPVSPYRGNPAKTYWKSAVQGSQITEIENLYVKKFPISPKQRIATAGSCFAQHISRHLRRNGYSVLDVEPAPPHLDGASAAEYGYGIYSARFGNIYYTRQLMQLAREVLEQKTPGEIVWERGGRYFDALRPSIVPNGHDSPAAVLAHRAAHLKSVKKLFAMTDIFVFTMGLTEAWELIEDGTIFPTAPGTVAGSFDPEKYQFKNFNYDEIVRDFLEFRILLRRINPNVKFMITVSPVPLAATATSNHVLTATTYSKSVLRAAAGEIERRCADVDYFPSYEIVTTNFLPNHAFDATGRGVLPQTVNQVMSYFFNQHPIEKRVKEESLEAAAAEAVYCEEALLEVFAV
ncbi:GSCFA domain-containing protein [Micrococcaceae bacterium Sec5.7]